MPDESIVLDSSVIVALYFTDPYSEWANDIVGESRNCYTVDIAYAEIGNVAWKRIHLFRQPKEIILLGLQNAIEFISDICVVINSRTIIKDARRTIVGSKDNSI